MHPVAFGVGVLFDRTVGGRFWLGMIATIVGIGIAAAIVFLLIGAALVTWGVLGAFIVFGGLALGIGWLYDRRRVSEYESLPE
jgi:uncharacterized membrane protein